MNLHQYIVSIDNEKHDIHAITVIYAAERELARKTVAENSVPGSVIGVYDKFPVILIEDGTNYVLSAWKPLQCALMVARQEEKVIALQNELERERATLANLEGILRKKKEEAEAIPQF